MHTEPPHSQLEIGSFRTAGPDASLLPERELRCMPWKRTGGIEQSIAAKKGEGETHTKREREERERGGVSNSRARRCLLVGKVSRHIR